MPTYTPLQSIELASTSTSVVFSNIPQTYEDLVIIFNGAITSGFDAINMQFNYDTTSLYSRTFLAGNGSSATSSRDSNVSSMQIGIMGTEQSSSIWNVMNYSNTTTNKTVISRGNSSANSVRMAAGMWRSTSAVNSITLTAASSTFITGSTFDLYGISPVAADTAQAFGGTEVYYDSSYVYHVFKDSGTFTPYRALTADILVVAGGGGGFSDSGTGGGGAGGLQAFTSQSLATTSYSVIVGAGGSFGSNGANSQFGSLTASVGGGSSNARGVAGSTGGSGGGGSSTSSGTGTIINGGAGTAGQGNSGGSGRHISGQYESGGGGGGAGAAGENGSSPTTGAGGNGSSTYSSWGLATTTGENVSGTYYYAGGGPGFNSITGGLGGGGTSAAGRTGTRNGLTNMGGGGGSGTAGGGTPGMGGSGLVIVRYAR